MVGMLVPPEHLPIGIPAFHAVFSESLREATADRGLSARLTPPTDFDTFLDMFLIRVLIGFLLVIVGLAYLFQPKTILRMNAFAREQIFKDAHVLLNARKIGTCLILFGFYLLLMTYWMLR